MKRTISLSLTAALLWCLVAANLLWAQSDQSLGDVARQKSAAKARRVVTNDEIPPSPEANIPAASVASGTSATGAAAKPGDKKEPGKAASPAEKQTKLQELLTDRENLQKILKRMQDKVAEASDEQRKKTFGEVVKHAQEALDENQQQIDRLRAAGAETKDQAPASQASPSTAPPSTAPPATAAPK